MVIVKQTLSVSIKHLEEVVELAQDVAQDAMTDEGCLSFEVYIQVEKPGNLVLLQNWQNEARAMNYLGSEGAIEFMQALEGLLTTSVKNVCYRVAGLGELAFEVVNEEQEALLLGDEVVVH
ncbi:MAG TPA: antibiotic biosynthesis monooxygenase [Alcanivoracaceae bacterium]|nr:antibiotic biosynthesis monooxygenase [Alcanivoracaceae bacterium]